MEASKDINRILLDQVLNASTRSYEFYGLNKSEIIINHKSNFISMFLPKLRRLEDIWTDHSFDYIKSVKYCEYKERGLEVWVLVPLNRMGKAHEFLRGKADWIQSWWVEKDSIKFGWPEKP